MITIDYQFYHGEDNYSDGDVVEQKILSYVAPGKEGAYDDAISQDPELATFYHLSDARNSLMNWYDFSPNSNVLEIGGGMGALTGILCERCEHVTCVELTKRRAECIAKRLGDKTNLHIMVGDITKMQFDRKFDYITVIGVLEHQSAVSDNPTAHEDFLKKLHPLLKTDGIILLAIENRFGLKYWCGDVDDHTGIPFGTLHQRNYQGRARTFDRTTLKNLLEKAGFPYTKFYYPMPDYKFPRVIYSDNYLPKSDLHSCVVPIHYTNYYPYSSFVANEAKLQQVVVQNGVFPFFANSFFVEASAQARPFNPVDFASVTVERTKEYQQIIRLKDGYFEKYAVYPEGNSHISQMHQNLELLKARGLQVIEESLVNQKLKMPNMQYLTMEDLFLSRLQENDTAAAMKILEQHYAIILKSSDSCPEKEMLLPDSLKEEAAGLSLAPIQKNAFCDMILSNCFMVDGQPILYDQEWRMDNLPSRFIMFRALSVVYSAHPWIEQILPSKNVWEYFEISEAMRAFFAKLQNQLFANVQNPATCARIGVLRQMDERSIDENIHLLMKGKQTIASLEEKKNQLQQIVAEKDTQIAGRDEVIAEKDSQIAGREQVIAEKDFQIAGRDSVICDKESQIQEIKENMRHTQKLLDEANDMILTRDTEICDLNRLIEVLQAELKSYRATDFKGRMKVAARVIRGE